MDPAAAARTLQRYAKQFHAGAFATPTAREIAEHPDRLVTLPGTVAYGRRLTRESVRADFTGRPFGMPSGSVVVTHLAHDPGHPLPDLGWADYVFGYMEDTHVTAGLAAQGRATVAVRVSAAAEVIGCWGPPGESFTYPAVDAATVARVPLTVPDPLRDAITTQTARLTGWDDDFPYYSDGSWGALSLKGFWPDDPARGVKPAEMPRTWKEEHPDDLDRRCDWTVLRDRVPAVADLVESLEWVGATERVRLLRMAGRGGKGGALGRHTDITDRASGTRDGGIVRFHIPLVTHPDIKLHAWDIDGSRRDVHLHQWGCYYLDARKPHAVTNPTGVDRVHLVLDVVSAPSVRSVITAAREQR